jgi:hypothetical protein
VKRLLFILIPILAFAQEPLTITGWRGLVTAKNDFTIAPNELRVCHDVDLSRNGDSTLSPRLGCVEVARIAGIDSILGLFTMNFRNGDKQMFIATDSSGVGYGNIYGSQLNSDVFNLDFGSQIDSLFIQVLPDTFEYIGTFINVRDTVVVYDSFFVAGDTFVIVDTVWNIDTSTTMTYKLNDTMVTKINASSPLNTYVTAGVVNDSSYFVKEDNGNVPVTFRYGHAVRIDPGVLIPTYLGYRTVQTHSANITPQQRLSSYWAIQRPTSFAQFNDLAYFVNGQQKGVVWNGDYLSQWPINAPGEPNVIPVTDHDNINGERAYILKYSSDSSGTEVFNSSFDGYTTPRVHIISGSAIVKDFPVPAITATDSTFNVKLYATKTTAGRFTESDYAYLDTTFIGLTPVTIQTLIYKDTIPDSALSTTDSTQVINHNFIGRRGDTLSGTVEVAFGAPRFVSSDTATTAADTFYNVYQGDPSTAIGVSYIISYTDTANQITSDSSRSLSIFRDSIVNDYETQYTIALPRAHSSNHVVKNIWRASLVIAKWDSVDVYRWRTDTTNAFLRRITELGFEVSLTGENDTTSNLGKVRAVLRKQFDKWDVTKHGDTVALDYRLVAQVPNSQLTYKDTTSYDSLKNTIDVFQSNPPPTGLEKIEVVNDQLVGFKGSRAYTSRTGKLTEWELFDFSSFNLDDGDHITMAMPFRGGVLIGKNYSAYNWLPDFTTTEITGIPGCVANQSAVKANGSIYYLSNSGIVALTEGQSLIRYHNSELLSKRLSNFTEKTFPDLQKCVGAYVPQNEQLWFCIGDTSYVYDIGVDLWSTSSLSFAGTSLYDVDTTVPFIPGRSLYFFQAGDSVIYKFGEGHKNAGGQFVNMKVETGPLFPDANLQQIMRYALWAQPEESYTLAALWFVDQGDTVTTVDSAGTLDPSLPPVNRRVSFKEMNNIPSIYYRLIIQSLSSTYPMTEGGIDRIDIWAEPYTEEPEFE